MTMPLAHASLLGAALYRPGFALGLIVVVLLLVVVSGVAAARRERLWWPLALRVVAVLGLGWVLMGYSTTRPSDLQNATKPTLTVLIDGSTSMGEQDAVVSPSGPAVTRLQAVRDAYLNDAVLDKLREVAEFELMPFDEQLRPGRLPGLAPVGKGTALYDAVSQQDADAVLILSDGHDTTRWGLLAADTSPSRLYAVPVGAPRSAPDLALQAWPDSDRLFEDQATTLTATVRQFGYAGQQATVELLLEGQPVEAKTITLDQRSTPVRFRVSPPLAVGKTAQSNHYTARVRLAQGNEAFLDNNAEDVFIQTSRGQIKVLLLEGEPYWDTRSLARLITGHPRFDLTARYAFGSERRNQLNGETIKPTADPTRELDTFDIVILGRHVQRLIDPDFASRLDTFVRSGGAVVFARGQPVELEGQPAQEQWAGLQDGLDAISPVDWAGPVLGEMRVRLGKSGGGDGGPLGGLEDGEVLSRLPGMLAATRIEGRKAASVVLLEQQPQEGPALAAMTSLRVGSGISLAVLTEGLWRWELLPGVDEHDPAVRSIYGVLWVRALQWLASGGAFLPGQDIALEPSSPTVDLDQPIELRISTRYVEAQALDLELTATHSNGTATSIQARRDSTGLYTAAFTPKETGVYTVRLTTPNRADLIEPGQAITTRFAVVERNPERRDTSAKPDALKRLVVPSGGACLSLGEVEPLIEYLQSLQAIRQSEDTVDYAFHQWPVFALIVGCLGLEWILRRRMGLR